MKRLLQAPNDATPPAVRDAAILEVLYGTAIRKSELYNLTVGDVDLSRRVVFIRRGKGQKDRVVPMGRKAAEALAQYLHAARMKLIKSPVESALFVNNCGRRLAYDFANRLIQKYLRRCGIIRPVTAHAIRHTVATHMLESGASIRIVQEMLGHARLDSTQIYTHVAVSHLRVVHACRHPRARLCARRNRDMVGTNGGITSRHAD